MGDSHDGSDEGASRAKEPYQGKLDQNIYIQSAGPRGSNVNPSIPSKEADINIKQVAEAAMHLPPGVPRSGRCRWQREKNTIGNKTRRFKQLSMGHHSLLLIGYICTHPIWSLRRHVSNNVIYLLTLVGSTTLWTAYKLESRTFLATFSYRHRQAVSGYIVVTADA